MSVLFKNTLKTAGWAALAGAIFAFAVFLPAAKPALAVGPDVIISSKYLDNNHDGTIDTIRWEMGGNVTGCAYDAGDWSIDNAGTVDATAIIGISCTGSDQYLDISVTSGAPNTTGGTADPEISYADNSGNVTLVSGDMSTKSAVAADDGAPPVPVSFKYKDLNRDGTVDTIAIQMSADFGLNVTYNDADWTITPGTILLGNETGAAIDGSDPNTVDLAVAGDPGVMSGATAPTVQFTSGGGLLHDGTGNAVASFGPADVADAAGPAFASASLEDDPSTQVELVINGTDFDTFVSSGTADADDFDLTKIFYGAHPVSAHIASATEIDAVFSISDIGTGKTGGDLQIGAGTVQDPVLNQNTGIPDVIHDGSIADHASPIIEHFVYEDTNHDGAVDRILFVTSRDSALGCHAFVPDVDFQIDLPGDVGLHSAAGDTCGSDGTNVWIDLQDPGLAGTTGGANSPYATSTPNPLGITDADGNPLMVTGIDTVLDGAAPVPVSATYVNMFQNGTIDGINVVWSENINTNEFDPGDYVFNGTSAFGVITAFASDTSGRNTNLIVSPANYGVTGSAAPLTFAYADQGTLGSINDAAGNASVTSAPITVDDAAPPVILSAKYLDIAPTDGTVDTVRFTTSADTGINCASFAGDTDFTVSNAGSVALAPHALDGCSSNGTDSFDISLHTPGALRVTGGADVPIVNYNQPGGGVQDGAGNDVPSAASVGVDDGAAPVIEQASYIDSNHDGAVDGVILFTTADTGLDCGSFTGDADFTVTTAGDVGLSTDGADHCSTNNVDQFVVALNDPGTPNVTGTSVNAPVVNYVQPGSGFQDGSANVVASKSGTTADDGAAPVPVSAAYLDTNHDGTIDEVDVNWSENIFVNEFEATDHIFNDTSAFGAVTATGLDSSGNTLAVYVSPDNSGVTGSPDPLTYTYTDSATSGSVRDADYNAAVTSGAVTATDNAAPVIISTSPANNATGVAATAPIVVDFSETMTPPGFLMPNCTFTTSPDPGGYLTASPATINPGTPGLWSTGANGLASSRVTLTHSTAYAASANVAVSIADCTANGAATAANPGVPASWSFTIRAATSGGGGGGASGVVSSPSIAVNTPAGGASYAPGAVLGIGWTPADGSFVNYKVSYSADNGATWSSIDDNAISTALSWTVPDVATTLGKIKVEGYDSGSNLLASATSGDFTITGMGTPVGNPPIVNLPASPPATDSTASGAYDPALAASNTPDINTDKGLTAPPVNTPVYCTAGTFIKGSLPAVYYCGKDGKRYVFVNDKVFFTWYSDFSSVITISDTDLAKIPLGGNITYRPGKRMIKVQSDPRVYVISRGGLLRWVSSEAIALQLFGPNWATMIDDVSDAFFVNYTMGPQL
jgi:hypothetical protein